MKIIEKFCHFKLDKISSCLTAITSYSKCQLGKTKWASKIRDILNGYGFG